MMGVQMKIEFGDYSTHSCTTKQTKQALEQIKSHNRNNAIGYANIIYIRTGNDGFIVVSRTKNRAVQIRVIDGNRKTIAATTTKYSLEDLGSPKKQISFIKLFHKFIKKTL